MQFFILFIATILHPSPAIRLQSTLHQLPYLLHGYNMTFCILYMNMMILISFRVSTYISTHPHIITSMHIHLHLNLEWQNFSTFSSHLQSSPLNDVVIRFHFPTTYRCCWYYGHTPISQAKGSIQFSSR